MALLAWISTGKPAAAQYPLRITHRRFDTVAGSRPSQTPEAAAGVSLTVGTLPALLRARNLVTLGAVLHRLNALVRDRWREQAGDDEEGRGNEVARMDEGVEEAEDEASEPLAPVGLGGACARAAAAAHRRRGR